VFDRVYRQNARSGFLRLLTAEGELVPTPQEFAECETQRADRTFDVNFLCLSWFRRSHIPYVAERDTDEILKLSYL
jgi:hypothetical protein